MPTDFFDFTSNLDVAVCFATDLSIGDRGALAVVKTETLIEFGKLVGLDNILFASRPKAQCALAFSKSENPNLKNPKVVKELELQWFGFEFTPEDAERFNPNPALLDAHSDRMAGTFELIINSYGKMNDKAAEWIAKRLQPAPFTIIKKTINGEPITIWVSAEEAGIPYEKSKDWYSNYESWSNLFAKPEVKELPKELLLDLNTVEDIKEGAILRVVGSRLLELLSTDFVAQGLLGRQDPSE